MPAIAYRRSTRGFSFSSTPSFAGRVPRYHVRQPVLSWDLAVTRRQSIPVASAEEAFARVASSDKTLEWVTGSGHVITVDYSHDAVARQAADWLESRLA